MFFFLLIISTFQGYNLDKNVTYYFRVPNSKRNKINPMSLDQKLRKEMSTGGSSSLGGFVLSELLSKKLIFLNTINTANIKHFPLQIFFLRQRLSLIL